MLYFGRVGSSWGHCSFFGSSWGEKVITPIFYFLYKNLTLSLTFRLCFVFSFLSFSPSIMLGKYSNFAYIKACFYYFVIKF
jgi:hypothetical protein